uniref:Serine palmitoyltransferase 1 n=1 Tax=Corethrella appendiculata TaxID=1370023 RepID=U5EZ28_9DIPT
MISTPYIFNEIYDIFQKSSYYTIGLELSLAFVVIWLIAYKKHKNGKLLTAEEKAEIIKKWKPEPLVGETVMSSFALTPRLVEGKVGKYITIDGQKCLNLATHNYLGFLEDKEIEESAIASLKKYGVGSCGPRGFYGTVDVHLELEERLAKFMEMEEAILYSYAFSTIASAIPAYSKRADIIFVDECVNFAIQKGLDASRSKICYYKHNDMRDLERLLEEQSAMDKKNPKKAAKTRRFLVAEAIYMNTGEMCPLRELVRLRKKYQLRLFLDESLSFGVLGKSGRGLTEFLQVDRTEVDLICASLEWAVASIGGFCVGSSFIIEHQRLSGLGYCFSASLPPLLTQAAITALDKFEQQPIIFKELNECCEIFDKKLQNLRHLKVRGHPLSPVKHLYMLLESDPMTEKKLLQAISDECIKNSLALITSEYLEEVEKNYPRPSIRLTVNRLLTDDDIDNSIKILINSSKKILGD